MPGTAPVLNIFLHSEIECVFLSEFCRNEQDSFPLYVMTNNKLFAQFKYIYTHFLSFLFPVLSTGLKQHIQ